MSTPIVEQHLADEAALHRLAARMAPALMAGDVIHLRGELGAGKTSFARALIQAREPQARVKSPTYTLIESYDLEGLLLHHLDLYRIAAPEELEYLGMRDLGGPAAALLIEWPERGGDAVPPPDLVLALSIAGSGRGLRLHAQSDRGAALLAVLA